MNSGGATVTTFPTLAAASGQMSTCPIPAMDTVTYVPKQTLIKHIKNYQVVTYDTVYSQVPVAQATAVQVVQHPTEFICPTGAVAAAGCGPCGGAGALGAGLPVGANYNKIGSNSGFSQTSFKW